MADHDVESTSQPVIPDDAPASSPGMSVNLHIVSPSLPGGPLVFSSLPSTTTVGQLKAKIGATLPTHPAPNGQRLIYLGRPLMEDGHTMQDIIGAETIRSSDKQTIHLVIRDGADGRASATATPIRGRSPAPPPRPVQHDASQAAQAAQAPTAHPHHQSAFRTYVTHTQAHHHPQYLSSSNQRPPQPSPSRHNPLVPPQTHPAAPSFPPLRMPSPIPTQVTPQQLAQFHAQQHQQMSQWIQQLHQHTMNRNIVAQNQRDRAAMGMHGIAHQNPTHQHPGVGLGIGGGAPGGAVPATMPHQARVAVPEGATNGTAVLNPGQPAPDMIANEIQRALNLRRSASSASLGVHRPVGQPPTVSTPIIPQSLSRAPSRRTTPDLTSRTPSGSSIILPGFPRLPVQPSPELYVLYSPEGPRAIVYNTSSETYYTPSFAPTRIPSARHVIPRIPSTHSTHSPQPPVPSPIPQQQPGVPQQGQDQHAADRARREAREHRRARRRARHGVANPHGNNHGMAAWIANMWPGIWLCIRLAIFFWAFGLPTQLWSRVITIIGIALIILANIGALNGPADQVWAHVRRYLEALLPMPDPPLNRDAALPAPAPTPAPPAGAEGENIAVARTVTTEPDPADTAARLIQQRREANANWVMDAVRRVERMSLLFLASIAPGVAERHIAHIEAEARAEQRRREAAAAAAADTASVAATAGGSEPDVDAVDGAAQEAAQAERGAPEPAQEPVQAIADAPQPDAEPMPVIAI